MIMNFLYVLLQVRLFAPWEMIKEQTHWMHAFRAASMSATVASHVILGGIPRAVASCRPALPSFGSDFLCSRDAATQQTCPVKRMLTTENIAQVTARHTRYRAGAKSFQLLTEVDLDEKFAAVEGFGPRQVVEFLDLTDAEAKQIQARRAFALAQKTFQLRVIWRSRQHTWRLPSAPKAGPPLNDACLRRLLMSKAPWER